MVQHLKLKLHIDDIYPDQHQLWIHSMHTINKPRKDYRLLIDDENQSYVYTLRSTLTLHTPGCYSSSASNIHGRYLLFKTWNKYQYLPSGVVCVVLQQCVHAPSIDWCVCRVNSTLCIQPMAQGHLQHTTASHNHRCR